jgi:anti-anti-sigma factor
MASQPCRPNTETTSLVRGPVAHFVRCPTFNESDIQAFGEQLFWLAEERRPQGLYLDFGGVEYITARALGMLVVLHKKLEQSVGRLVLYNVSGQIYEVFATVKLQTVLDIRHEGLAAYPWEQAQAVVTD